MKIINGIVQVINQEIQIKEFNGQRVVKFKDIDRVHERPESTARGLIFITESGYLILTKFFTDDLAWEVHRQLVNCYFRVKEEEKKLKDNP